MVDKRQPTPSPIKKWCYPFQGKATSRSPTKAVEVSDPQVYFAALATAADGFYPVGTNGLWHGGIHFDSQTASRLAQDAGVRCIADGEVIAYRLDSAYPSIDYPSGGRVDYSRGFVLVKHRLQLPPKAKTASAFTAQATPDSNGEPSLTLFSLYMHLLDWSGYEAKVDLVRPAFWVDPTKLVVGGKAMDADPYTPTAPAGRGINVRQSGRGSARIGWLPPGAAIAIEAGSSDWRRILSVDNKEMATDPEHVATVDAPLGWIYVRELDPTPGEPKALGDVVVPEKPLAISAGELIGYLGQYGRHADRSPMATSERLLAHIEVFSGDDVPEFLGKSRVRGKDLDIRYKTLLVLGEGTTLVLPAEADQRIPASVEVELTDDSPKSGHWAKVKPLAHNPTPTKKKPKDPKLTPTGESLWIERMQLNVQGQRTSTSLAIKAWSHFPLQATNTTGPKTGYQRVAATRSLKATAVDDKGVRWWEVDVDTPDAKGNILGWACEADHLQSPWDWPGFEIISDTATLTDLHSKQIIDQHLDNPADQGNFQAKAERAKEGELFQALYEVIDTNKKGGLTTGELRAALKKPWLAQTLSRVIARYESEWGGEMSKWDALDDHMGESADDWAKEKGRIRDLQWWKELKGKHGLPASPVACHFHPIGLIGNFGNQRAAITLEMLKRVFDSRSVNLDKLQSFVDEINAHIEDYKLDTNLRLSHFFAQVREEAGANARTIESLNYTPSGLKALFSYFRRNPQEAERYGRTTDHPADQQAIANRAYSNREGHGAIALGEGWRYRGRGLKQLTWKANYQSFQDNYKNVWPNESPDFINNPDLLIQPKYAVRSAVYFWLHHSLYEIADRGPDDKNVNSITEIINKSTNSYGARRNHFRKIWRDRIFDSVEN